MRAQGSSSSSVSCSPPSSLNHLSSSATQPLIPLGMLVTSEPLGHYSAPTVSPRQCSYAETATFYPSRPGDPSAPEHPERAILVASTLVSLLNTRADLEAETQTSSLNPPPLQDEDVKVLPDPSQESGSTSTQDHECQQRKNRLVRKANTSTTHVCPQLLLLALPKI